VPQFLTNDAAIQLATSVFNRLTTEVPGEVRLFKSTFVPTVTSTLAEYQAAQCDFSGYVAQPTTNVLVPTLAPGGGAQTIIGTVQFLFNFGGGGTSVGNVVGGYYVVAPVDPGGQVAVLAAGTFDTPVPMQFNGQSIPLNLTVITGR